MSNNLGANQEFKTLKNLTDHINSIPTEDIAGKLGLKLQKIGNSLQGNCPTGDHPSKGGICFSINTRYNYWRCFSCRKTGNNIGLVEATLKKNSEDSIEWITKQFNIAYSVDLKNDRPLELTDEEKEKIRISQTRAVFYEEAFTWMHEQLFDTEGKEALYYLVNERKYDPVVLKNSEFCCFPGEKKIREYLKERIPNADAEICSLPLIGAYGDYFEVAIPYRNNKGLITGFMKRSSEPAGTNVTLKDGTIKEGVRWDSTYGLSKTDLFNLDKCKGQETLLIVEGYPDAVYFHALGLSNVVAVGQGRLSKSHLEGLRVNKVNNVIIAFDNDAVGPKNTIDAVKLLLQESDVVPFVLEPTLLSPQKDPDEYVRANNIDAFNNLLKKVSKGLFWLADKVLQDVNPDEALAKEKAKQELLELVLYVKDPTDTAYIIKLMVDNLQYSPHDAKALVNEKRKEQKISDYQSLKEKDMEGKRFVPFIEKSTSSYSYWDTKTDTVHLGVSGEILENILASGSERLPDVLPVLKIDFDVKCNERLDYDREIFNLFVPSKYMLLQKTSDCINPRKQFPHIYRLLMNLFPKYQERKLYLNWLAGILQTREKQLTAWVLKGIPGAGKGLMLDYVLKPIFGPKQAIKVEDGDLNSQFNPWLQNVIIIAFNEVAHDNNTRNSIKSKIKAIITDGEMMINEKNVKNYLITNYVNCLFFSNETIPVFIEIGDRRFNVVVTGGNLRDYDWFKKDPETFISFLSTEVPYFAQFLINWKYDPVKAKTCISNEEKELLVSAGMNRFEEFAFHLKKEDEEWFKGNMNSIFSPTISFTKSDMKGGIRKELALRIYNEMYHGQPTNDVQLGKQLKLYGIRSERIMTNGIRENFYLW